MSVLPTERPTEEALRPATPLNAALDRRFTPTPQTQLTSAIDKRFQGLSAEAQAITPEDIDSFAARFPDAAAKLSRNQIEDAIRFDRSHPGGSIGPGKPSFLQRIQFAAQDVTAMGSEFQFAGGLQTGIFQAGALHEQANAAFADFIGMTDLAAEHRLLSQALLDFNAQTELGSLAARGGLPAGAGELVANIAPSALSLLASGGASGAVLAYYGIQSFGAGAQDYRETMQAQGLTPDAVDQFAIGIGYAVVEIVAEKIGLDVIGRKIGPKLAKDFGDLFLRGKTGKVAGVLLKAELITDVEGTEELLTEFLQNAIASKGIPFVVDGFDPQRGLDENLLRAFLMGKAGAHMLIGPAAIAGRRQRQDVPTAEEAALIERSARAKPAVKPGQAARPPGLPPIIPPPAAEADTSIAQTVGELEPQDRAVAEEAALEVLADETADPRAQQRAAEIVEELDRTEPQGPAIVEDEGTPSEKMRTELPPRPTAKQRAAFIKRLGIDAKRSGERTVTEKAALNASLRAQKRIAAILIPKIRAETRLAEKEKRDIDRNARTQIRRIVRSIVSPGRQGAFLREVETATPARLQTILDKIDQAATKDQFDESATSLQKLQKRLKKAKIRTKDRTRIGELLSKAKAALFDGKRKKTFVEIKEVTEKTEAFRNAVTQAEESLNEASQELADQLAARKSLLQGRLADREAAIDQTLANINAPPSEGLQEDVRTSILGKLKNALADVRNLTRLVEQKTDDAGVLEQLMWRQMTRSHGAHLLHVSVRLNELESAAKRAGFKGLADALAKLSGHSGKAMTETIEVEIGGTTTTMTMGEALWFAAIDSETQALLDAGAPLQLSRGREQTGVVVTLEEIEAIRAKLPANLVAFVQEAKKIADQDTDALFETLFELKGREPTRVPGYFRRRRNIVFTEKAGLPKTFQGVVVQYLENLGFTREREVGIKSPIIIEDFLTALMDHMQETSKVIHVARTVRDAAGVLLDSRVQAAINTKHGSGMNDDLQTHLGAASLARRLTGSAARAVRFLNANLAVAKLGLNPSSILRQLGGIPRLAPILGPQTLADGVAGAINVSMQEMTGSSGFFWERYIANISGRFSPVEDAGQFGFDRAGLEQVYDRAAQSMLAGDVLGAYQALRDGGLSTLLILNFFDSINARIAWAGYRAEVERQHPEWSRQQKTEWVAEHAEDAVRETQNSSSVLDLSTAAIRSRGTLYSLWLLFSSDRMKAANRIRRAFGKGAGQPGRGAAALGSELTNALWSVGVGRGTSLVTSLFIALALGDDDDREEAIKRSLALDRAAFAFANETISLIDPLILPRFLDMIAYQQADLFDTAVGSSITDLAEGSIDLVTLSKPVRGLRKIGMESAALLGLNPLDAMMKRILSAYDKLDDDEQERLISLQ